MAASRNNMIAFETSFLAKKMPHLVVPARFFRTCWENTHNFIDNGNQTETPSSPTAQNTRSRTTHTSKSLVHTLARHPLTDTNRHLSQTCTHINRRDVTDFVGGLSCVDNIAMTDGLAPKRQRFGNHDDLVSVPVPDVSSASVNTTQTSEKKTFSDNRCSARLLC